MRHLTQKSLERGKITLTVPKSKKGVIQMADKLAKKKGMPFSALILDAVEERLEKEEFLISDFEPEDELNALSDEELIGLSRRSLSGASGSLSEAEGPGCYGGVRR